MKVFPKEREKKKSSLFFILIFFFPLRYFLKKTLI